MKKFLNEKKKQKEREQLLDTGKKVGAGLVAGTVVGSTLGLLFAPQSGEETVEDIKREVKDSTEKIKSSFNDVVKKVDEKKGSIDFNIEDSDE